MHKFDKNLTERVFKRLKEIDERSLSDNHVVLLPDFFVDHFLTFGEFEEDMSRIKEIFNQGGGNVQGVSQKISQGGNASNTALALRTLGFSSHLICKTSKFGLHMLDYFLGKKGVDLSHVKTDGKLALTTALEFGKNHTNVMIGDAGSVSDFSFEIINDNDKELISESNILFVGNWNLNKNGTEFARTIFEFAKKHYVKTFFDTGDPSPRKNEIPDLIKNVLSSADLDVLGLNENELSYYSGIEINSTSDAIKALTLLKKNIHARLDLHTANYACSINENSILIPTPSIKEKYRSTGAGDAWNAGNIFADVLGFESDERLFFANSVACFYISSPEPTHPTLEQLISYIRKV